MEKYNRLKEVKEFDDSKMGVKGLVDSGITSIPKFFIHSPQNLTPSVSSILQVPIIDLSGLNNSDRRSEITRQIHEAASTWGFFQIINHSIPSSVLNSTISAIKSFHEQPQHIKKNHYVRGQPVSYATNIDLFRSKAASWRDTLMMSMAPQAPKHEQIPQICREEVVAWDGHVRGVAEVLSELLCEGLGIKKTKLVELKCLGLRLMVGHYYPYCPEPDLTMGIPSHTDKEVLTVLLQNQNGGLQVKFGEVWVDVKPVPGALVINLGDFLQMISNDEYKSGEHRVLANPGREPRISIAVFVGPAGKEDNSDCFGPLEELLSPEKPPLYRKFSVSEIRNKFSSKELANMSMFEYFKL